VRRSLTKFWGGVVIALAIVAILVAINQIFLISLFGFILLEISYLHLLLGICLAIVFICYSPTKGAAKGIPWYDVLLACLSVAIGTYFSCHGMDILTAGWMFAPPHVGVTVSSVMLSVVVLEALRRVTGLPLFLICLFFAFYPTFAGHMPGFLEGHQLPIVQTMTFHPLSPQSIVGLPMRVVATLLIGFMLFGIVLMHTGGGKFFLDLAGALFGRFRGGTAKVAVVASSLFGSMSGSSISNVITTGSITIPAMKKAGFAPYYAGAVESCASTGGIIMPPIMGAAAFLMASFLSVPYLSVVIAAIIPSILYYVGLFLQVDAFAAKEGIRGLSPSEIPSLKKVLREGWVYIFSLLILVYFLYLRLEAMAPFYAMAFLIAAAMVRKETRLDFNGFWKLFEEMGHLLGQLTITIGAIGFIVGSLALTGVGASLSKELVGLAAGNVYLMLVFGAAASYVLGMGMTTSACYIFLAIVLAPGLEAQGFNAMAVHLFVLYWGIVSNITPPVALATFPAASISGAKATKIAFTSMRLGAVIYIVPFLFVLNPSLILQGSPTEFAYYMSTALVGLALAAAGLGRYLMGIGNLPLITAIALVVLGLLVALPLGIHLPLGIQINILALACAVIMIGFLLWRRRSSSKEEAVEY